MKQIPIVMLCMLCMHPLFAQIYTPVPVTGFNQDVVADTGTNAEIVTGTDLDLSLNILYSVNFATANSITGGMPDNGLISNGGFTFQLEDYSLNNALYLSAGGFQPNTLASGTLTLVTPASFSKITLLTFSTELFSVIDVVLNYTDSTSSAVSHQQVSDWFDAPNAVVSGFGRIKRQPAGPYVVDGLTGNNPRFYHFDIELPCAEQTKTVASITVTHISGNSAAARALVLAVAGEVHTPVYAITTITPTNCGMTNGTATINVTGGAAPLTYEWSTTPVQVTNTIAGLPSGTYTCTITDRNTCQTFVQADVIQESVIKLKAQAKPTTMCEGSSTTLYAIPAGANIANYTWQPGNITDSSIRVSPTDTITYVVTGEDLFGCIATDSIRINVIPKPRLPVVSPLSVCPDSIATLTIENPDPALTYNWYPLASGGDLADTGTVFNTSPSSGTTTWYVEAVNGLCGGDRTPVTVTAFPQATAPVVTAKDITATGATFTWDPVPGATGYLVSIDGGPYVTPDSATYYKVTGLNQELVNIKVIALGVLECQNSLPGTAIAKLKPGDIFVPNAFTPNGDGLNDIFKPEGNMKTVNMKIFNQWGQLISETNVVGSGWNGMSGGKAQPSGVYTYAIRIILNDNSIIVKKGAVNLLR